MQKCSAASCCLRLWLAGSYNCVVHECFLLRLVARRRRYILLDHLAELLQSCFSCSECEPNLWIGTLQPYQSHSQTKCTLSVEAYRSTVCRWRLSSFNDALLQLASCLIYARPLQHDIWLVGARFVDSWRPFRVLVWVRSFIEPDFLETMYHSTI